MCPTLHGLQEEGEASPIGDPIIALIRFDHQFALLNSNGGTSALELTRLMLDRIEKLNGSLNAFITVTADSALAEAEKADRERKRDALPTPVDGDTEPAVEPVRPPLPPDRVVLPESLQELVGCGAIPFDHHRYSTLRKSARRPRIP